MRRFLSDYSLSVVLGAMFVISWLVQTIAGWFHFASEQAQHGQAAQAFGPDGYVWEWASATFENWQSEFLQLFTFVVLTTFLIHRHSHESRDEQDKMQAQIELILAKLEEKR
jgi:hypothetical protein